MQTEPVPEHEWLKKLVGDWSVASQCETAPGEPDMNWTGEETVRAMGDLWVVGEGSGTLPGDQDSSMTSLIVLGFDPAKGKFVGSWVGSPVAYQFIYEGLLDAERRVLTLETEGPGMHDQTELLRYQDIVEFANDDTRVLRSLMHPSDGSAPVEIMRATYTRRG